MCVCIFVCRHVCVWMVNVPECPCFVGEIKGRSNNLWIMFVIGCVF